MFNFKIKLPPHFGNIERSDPNYIDEVKEKLVLILENYKESDFQIEFVEIGEDEGYDECPDVVSKFFQYFKILNEQIEFTHLPYTLTKILGKHIKIVETEFKRIKGIENSGTDINKENVKKLEDLYQNCELIFDRVITWEEISRKNKHLDTLIIDIEQKQKETDDFNKKSKDLLVTSILNNNAKKYEEYSLKLKTEINIWIGLLVVLLIITFGIGWYLLYYSPNELIMQTTSFRKSDPKPDADSIKNMENNIYLYYGIARIVIFSVLFYAINFCVKNFKAIKHNIVVNEQRFNSLSTYELFVKTADDETKKELLKIVFNTIFTHQSTNFETDTSNKIEDVWSSISSFAKK